jgi:hypothetical protein
MERELVTLAYGSTRPRSLLSLHTEFMTPGPFLMDGEKMPGDSHFFASMFGTDVVRLDPTTNPPRVRHRSVGLGAGELAIHGASQTIYIADLLFKRLKEVDARALKLKRELPLAYTPRPVAVDQERDLIFVGSWLNGAIHVYQRSTLTEIGNPIPTGPYLRDLIYHGKTQKLYAASKCGVYEVNVADVFN